MKRAQKLLTRICAIVISVFGMSMLAQANSEMEPNSSISSAQAFAASSSELNVSGNLTFLGFDPRTRQPILDVDYYSFFAFAGDSIDVDVSGVNNSVALFGLAPGHARLASGDMSSRMSGYVISESGMYTVAVANNGAFFSDGGTVSGGAMEQGAYSLSVSGLSLPLMQVSIDVKPHHIKHHRKHHRKYHRKHHRKYHSKVARINLKKERAVKVAILGDNNGFNVADVDVQSLTFGATGDEKTLRKCKRRVKDVNRDGVPDLVCKFSLRGADFDVESFEAVLKGKTRNGTAFYGSDQIAVKEHRKVSRRSRRK